MSMSSKIKQVIVAAGPIIIEDGRVLLNKHGEDKFWKFLGGRVESEDSNDAVMSLENACKREVKEENGFDIDIICPLKPMMVPKPNSDGVYVVLIHFLAKRLGDGKLGEDIKDSQEFNIEQLIAGKYAGEEFAPNIVPVLQSYLDLKKKGFPV